MPTLKLELLIEVPGEVFEQAEKIAGIKQEWDTLVVQIEQKGLECKHSQTIVNEKAKAPPPMGKKRGRPAKTTTAPLLDQAAE